jgi:hypothetical protein
MKHTTRIAALLAALAAGILAGCTGIPGRYPPGVDPQRPRVTTDGQTIGVDQELLSFAANGVAVRIAWQLPREGAWRFVPGRGIVVEGRLTDRVLREPQTSVVLDPAQTEIVDCAADEARLRYTCTNRRTRFGVYKYTIRLTDGKREITRDPLIANW